MTYPKGSIHLFLFDNESDDDTLSHLLNYTSTRNGMFASCEVGTISRDDKEGVAYLNERYNIVNVRNQFLDKVSGRWHMMMLDSDCIPPLDGVERLFSMVEGNGAGIAAGITIIATGKLIDRAGKIKPIENIPEVTAFIQASGKFRTIGRVSFDRPDLVKLPANRIGIFTVDVVGTGMCMINKALGNLRFTYSEGLGEDFLFCQKVASLGYPVVVDTTLWYDHLHYEYRLLPQRNGSLTVAFKGIRGGRGRMFLREPRLG